MSRKRIEGYDPDRKRGFHTSRHTNRKRTAGRFREDRKSQMEAYSDGDDVGVAKIRGLVSRNTRPTQNRRFRG